MDRPAAEMSRSRIIHEMISIGVRDPSVLDYDFSIVPDENQNLNLRRYSELMRELDNKDLESWRFNERVRKSGAVGPYINCPLDSYIYLFHISITTVSGEAPKSSSAFLTSTMNCIGPQM